MAPRPRNYPQPDDDTLAKFEQLSQRMLRDDNDRRNATADRSRDWIKFTAWVLSPVAIGFAALYVSLADTKRELHDVQNIITTNRSERVNSFSNTDREVSELKARINYWEPDWKITQEMRENGQSNKEYFFKRHNYAAPLGKESN